MSFFNLASKKMQWLSVRQNVIAQNVANADTPGYRAQEASPFEDMLRQSAPGPSLQVTNARHVVGDPTPGGGPVRVEEDQESWASSLNGNSVVLEQQAIKAGEVSENYRLAANLYRKGYELLTLSVTGIR